MDASNKYTLFRILSYIGVIVTLFFVDRTMQEGFGGGNPVPWAIGLFVFAFTTIALMVFARYYKTDRQNATDANAIAVEALNELAKQKTKDPR